MLARRLHTIDVAEALVGLRAGRLELIDVREAGERGRAYAPGSRHLPLSELRHRLDRLPTDRPLAFICQSGRRSTMAATAARRVGLDAYSVQGGMNAWERQGLDTERSAS